MKKLMNICYKCGSSVKLAKCKKEGITLDCTKCPECGEEFFTSSEILKLEKKSSN
jgi:ribosomal protein S27AE